MGVDAAALSLARPDASVPCWRNWSPEANLSLSLFVLFSGIISVKDEDVVACGNFHLVVIRSLGRSLAERRITSVFDGAAAAFPSLFSPSDENCSSLSSGPLRQEWRRTNGANATRSDRGERSPIELLWSSGGRDFRNRRKWPVFLSEGGERSRRRVDRMVATKNDQ